MKNLLQTIPQIDKLSNEEIFNGLTKETLLKIIKNEINNLREKILDGSISEFNKDELIQNIFNKYTSLTVPSLKKLINATGVVVHTNLGRSLLSDEIYQEASEFMTSYSNLEFDIKTGKRGERYDHLNNAFKDLIGCEDFLIVNNNASAVFLILNTFAKNKEAIVSRGELVEIGGSFRIPDVMRESGAILKEVGCTNKTHLYDYKNAINQNTSMLMKVHRSNFLISGFTQEIEFDELTKLANENSLIDYYDLGSGYLENFGIKDELPLDKIAQKNPSIVSFSGDKLFGGVQAGIIFGKKDLINKLKSNQLLRMLRVDKFTIITTMLTIKAYLEKTHHKIPTVWMLYSKKEDLFKRAKDIAKTSNKDLKIVETNNFVGGGAMPQKEIFGVAIEIFSKDVLNLQKQFREQGIITRVENSCVLIEVRTILDKQIVEVGNIIKKINFE